MSPSHRANVATLDDDEFGLSQDLWADRRKALRSRPDVEYVLLFENRGADAGTTTTHPHGQPHALGEAPQAPPPRGLSSPTCQIFREIGRHSPAGRLPARRVVYAAEGRRAGTRWSPFGGSPRRQVGNIRLPLATWRQRTWARGPTSTRWISGETLLMDVQASGTVVDRIPVPADWGIIVVDAGPRRSVEWTGYGVHPRELAMAAGVLGPLRQASLAEIPRLGRSDREAPRSARAERERSGHRDGCRSERVRPASGGPCDGRRSAQPGPGPRGLDPGDRRTRRTSGGQTQSLRSQARRSGLWRLCRRLSRAEHRRAASERGARSRPRRGEWRSAGAFVAQ